MGSPQNLRLRQPLQRIPDYTPSKWSIAEATSEGLSVNMPASKLPLQKHSSRKMAIVFIPQERLY